jgi:hypothetical protein
MTHEVLPAPVVALIEAGREKLASGLLASSPATPVNVPGRVLTAYAQRHGMLAWAPMPLDEGVLRAHMTRALDGARVLQQVTAALARANVEALALKGPALSQWLYGDPCARRFSDLDLLVAASRRDAAQAALEQLGFSARLPRGTGDVIYGSTGAWPMDRDGSHSIDLHWRLSGRRFSQVVSTGEVLARAREVSLGSVSIRVPCADHVAALTLAHAAKHVWYALELPFSIAVMARRSDIDWAAVRHAMLAAGALRGAAAGLSLAGSLFEVDVPAAFRPDTERQGVAELCRCARTALALPPGTFPGRALERRMHRLAFDRFVDRVRYDVRRVVEPTHAEVEWVSLPRVLSTLYWPVRLVRLGALVLGAV